MSAELLDAADGRRRLAISGLGCGEILGLEAGLHVLEHVGEAAERGQIVDRDQVQVVVSGNGPGLRGRRKRRGLRRSSYVGIDPGSPRSFATASVAIEPGGSISSWAATSTCSS